MNLLCLSVCECVCVRVCVCVCAFLRIQRSGSRRLRVRAERTHTRQNNTHQCRRYNTGNMQVRQKYLYYHIISYHLFALLRTTGWNADFVFTRGQSAKTRLKFTYKWIYLLAKCMFTSYIFFSKFIISGSFAPTFAQSWVSDWSYVIALCWKPRWRRFLQSRLPASVTWHHVSSFGFFFKHVLHLRHV